MSNKLTRMAHELLEIEEDFPCRIDYTKEQHTIDDFDLYTFRQRWGSTELGFGGIGGCTVTGANTYVLIPHNLNHKCLVYFAGRYAYSAPYCQALLNDVSAQNMAPVYKAGKYH